MRHKREPDRSAEHYRASIPQIASLNWLQRDLGHPGVQAVGKGAGLLVCEKQSWALEGAWAFAKGRKILQRVGRGAGAWETHAGKTDAAEILI